MKKIIIASFLIGASLLSFSQVKPKASTFLQTAVSSGSDRIVNENVELGLEYKGNRVSAVAQSFNASPNAYRKYLLGVKYLRLLPVLPNLAATVSVAAKTRVDNVSLYVIEPGAGLNFNLGRGIGLVTGVSSPVTQVSYNKREIGIAGNAGLIFKL